MPFNLPALSYDYNALEPYIDEETMKIHHDKHHAAYVEKLNSAFEKHNDLSEKTIEDLMTNINSIPEDIRTAVRNNGGGHFNHSFFWELMAPGKGGEPKSQIDEAITSSFGSFSDFKEQFKTKGIGRFGSGWVWLINDSGKLAITDTPNQDNPLMEGKTPILGLDVWEHAYYLKYQNRRPEYIDAWWNVVNWDKVNENFLKTK